MRRAGPRRTASRPAASVWSLSSVRHIDRSSEARVSPSPFLEGPELQSVIQITDGRTAALYHHNSGGCACTRKWVRAPLLT